MERIVRIRHLDGWQSRRPWLDEWVEDSMCKLNRAVKERSDAPSLALVRPRDVGALRVTRRDGWSADEQRKIDAYVGQLDLLSSRDRTPLEAPRFRATYEYRCWAPTCKGHRQGIIDWELVALQRRYRTEPDETVERILREKFLDEMCAADRDVAFYVGNQAKRLHVFSVLGTYWPRRR
ncbi:MULTISPECIES: hypothetical protein [Catenuloplanes]|uniref:Uncharacterized protein n=1 Tax=Catenuloplanes niger TaxID=587534 RepID=A0AAE3ZRP9_9ACTN|nr:hypothetical protein [Catenuloplanes niger]MDR7323769.1 hypothetical protein [Catenuloplanes niger]